MITVPISFFARTFIVVSRSVATAHASPRHEAAAAPVRKRYSALVRKRYREPAGKARG